MARKSAKPQPNLFMTFREVTTADGQPFAEALRWLNDKTGKSTTNSRYGQYERGELKPTTGSLNLILSAVLESKLKAVGLQSEAIKEVIESCHVPEKNKGKQIRKRQTKNGKTNRHTSG